MFRWLLLLLLLLRTFGLEVVVGGLAAVVVEVASRVACSCFHAVLVGGGVAIA